jgi:aminoglycoside 3-N-acetyltransferase
MVAFRELVNGLRQLDLHPGQPVLAHVSLSSFGEVRGGEEAVIGALLTVVDRVMMPSFTYKTMVIPLSGPEDNGIQYGSGKESNLLAEIYRSEMPADNLMGRVAEAFRQHPDAIRSLHPILSFAGVGVDEALSAQTILEPLAPIRVLMEQNGWVLLAGVDHSANTALHLAEHLAGRHPFVRWGLTLSGIYECPGFPGCSHGFQQAASYLTDMTRSVKIGNAVVQAIPMQPMINTIAALIQNQPGALLCHRPVCDLCPAVLRSIGK